MQIRTGHSEVTRLARLLLIVASAASAAFAEAPDLTSPKSAARSVYAAVDRGDEIALRETFFVEPGQPLQEELVAANARMVIAGKRLADAAREKFPGASDAMTQRIISADDLAALDQATVDEQDDVAVLKFAGSTREMRFQCMDGKWRLVIAEFGGATDQNLSEQNVLVREFADAMAETAGEIAADKYPTPQEAEAALQAKINVILAKSVRTVPLATQPAAGETTSPTTGPSR
jgi:hypothetical protein